MNICFATDRALFNYIKVPIRSILHHTKEKVKFYVLTRGISKYAFNKHVNQLSNSEYYQVPMDAVRFEKVKLAKWVTVSTMDRLLIPSLLKIDKLIYLDIDLVVNTDLKPLYDHPTGECGLAAKQSSRAGYLTNIDYAKRTHLDHEALRLICGEYHNFNAGVLVMDLKKMRANDSERITLDIVKRTYCNDQIALASYSKDRFVRLEPHWNTWVGVDHQQIEKPSIIHFVGGSKPWKTNTLFKEEWKKWR